MATPTKSLSAAGRDATLSFEHSHRVPKPHVGAAALEVVTQPQRLRMTWHALAAAAGRTAREQKLSAAIVFWTKSLRDPVAIGHWIDFVIKHHAAFSAEAPNVRVLRKPQRNYGVAGLSVKQRVSALISHYRFAARRLPAQTHNALLGVEQIPLARLTARDTFFDLWLGSSLPFGQKQEGELTVWLTNSEGISLARMAFSFGEDAGGEPTLLIGGLQGLSAGVDKKVIVQATRALSGLRPKDAVFVGVQAVGRAVGAVRLLAVANLTHVLAAEWFMSDSVISRDYDGFWKERGGEPEPGIGFALPMRDYGERAAATPNPRLIDLHRAALTEKVMASLVTAK